MICLYREIVSGMYVQSVAAPQVKHASKVVFLSQTLNSRLPYRDAPIDQLKQTVSGVLDFFHSFCLFGNVEARMTTWRSWSLKRIVIANMDRIWIFKDTSSNSTEKMPFS